MRIAVNDKVKHRTNWLQNQKVLLHREEASVARADKKKYYPEGGDFFLIRRSEPLSTHASCPVNCFLDLLAKILPPFSRLAR